MFVAVSTLGCEGGYHQPRLSLLACPRWVGWSDQPELFSLPANIVLAPSHLFCLGLADYDIAGVLDGLLVVARPAGPYCGPRRLPIHADYPATFFGDFLQQVTKRIWFIVAYVTAYCLAICLAPPEPHHT